MKEIETPGAVMKGVDPARMLPLTLYRIIDLVAGMENHTSLRIAPDHFLGGDEPYGYHCSVITREKTFTGYAAELDDALAMLEAKMLKQQKYEPKNDSSSD